MVFPEATTLVRLEPDVEPEAVAPVRVIDPTGSSNQYHPSPT